jgi:hypothetical protein
LSKTVKTFPILAALTLASCGYVGDPLPPSLQIPPPVQDLRVEERGAQIFIHFTLPGAATDGAPFRSLRSVELQAGSQDLPVPMPEPGPTEITEPAAPWVGQTLEFRVRSQGPSGRWSDWSASVSIQVVTPLDPPSHVTATDTAQGVQLSWDSPAPRFRVFREEAGALTAAGETAEHIWLDEAAVLGRQYAYRVQAIQGDATSEDSSAVEILYQDRFPPATPAEVKAVAGLNSIELTWRPPSDRDLAGFFVYRASGSGMLQRLGAQLSEPSFSDAMVESGRSYRYAVSAVDLLGNESPRSAEVLAVAP